MQIVGIKVKNFLAIRDLELKPGQVNQICGQNNQGKTAVLKALEFAVKGGSDGSMVHHGADAAEVIVELDDQTMIRRRLSNEGRSTLSVKREGFEAPKPQAYLDGLFDGAAFNPLDLLDPKRRSDAILKSIEIKVDPDTLAGAAGWPKEKMPPLDFTQHGLKVVDQAHGFFYARRAEANKEAAEKKKRFDTYREDLPKEDVAPAETRDQLKARQAAEEKTLEQIRRDQEAVTSKEQARIEALARVKKYEDAVAEIATKIRWHQEEIKLLEARRSEGVKFVETAKAEIPAEVSGKDLEIEVAQVHTKLQEISKKLVEVERHEQFSKQRERVNTLEKEWQEAMTFADSIDAVVKKLHGPIQEELMSKAEMPVKGLEYRDGVFSVDGVSVDNLSTSASIKLAIGVARKLAKKTKVICIDGAEAMDDETYKTFRDQVEGDGYTYFLTRVGECFLEDRDHVITMKDGKAESTYPPIAEQKI